MNYPKPEIFDPVPGVAKYIFVPEYKMELITDIDLINGVAVGEITIEQLTEMIQNAPGGSVLVFEDINKFIDNREEFSFSDEFFTPEQRAQRRARREERKSARQARRNARKDARTERINQRLNDILNNKQDEL